MFVPYVEGIRASLKETKPALVIMDNFKGQCTEEVDDVLKQNDVLVCRLPPNTTDRLQLMDLSVNKPAKDFLKRKFEQWYVEEINNQLQSEDVEMSTLQPIDLAMPVMKELGAEWLVEMADYIADNPQFIVNGFIRSGITAMIMMLSTVVVDICILACEQLADIINELPNFTEWRMLGLRLGLISGQLDIIEVDYRYAGERLHQVLLKWLRRCYNQDKYGPPTWSRLADAIEQINPALCVSIHTKHCTPVPL